MNTPADVALVPVLRRKELAAYALCDASDHAMLVCHRWRLHPRGYAVACIEGARDTLMHRLLLGLKPGSEGEGDHINRNKLDNRRCNLRIVSHLENSQNHPGLGGDSEYRGFPCRVRPGSPGLQRCASMGAFVMWGLLTLSLKLPRLRRRSDSSICGAQGLS